MDDSYSSSFESDDENKTTEAEEKTHRRFLSGDLTESSMGGNILDFRLLNQAVEDIQKSSTVDKPAAVEAEGATSRPPPTNGQRTSQKEISLHSSSTKSSYREDSEKSKHSMQTVLYFKRSLPTFKGSASINRRKKLQQIEHDNMVGTG